MDLWTFNKIAAAVLISALVIFGADTATEILYPTGGPGTYQVVQLEEAEPETTAEEQTEEPAPEKSLAVLLASASAADGENVARQCSACHVFDEGGPNRVGPNLYGVVGREVAAVDGFSYSNALQEYGGEWNYERLDCFLKNPSECVAGTSMGYAGIKDPEKRADMIAYLASLGEAPPLPEVEEQAEDTAEVSAPSEKTGETAAATAPDEDMPSEPSKADMSKPAAQEPAPEANETAAQEAAPEETAQPDSAATTSDDAAQKKDGAEQTADAADPAESKLTALFANADPAAGKDGVRVCSACHVFEEGGPNRVGPNLYGVVGREVASVEGFRYSQALQEYGGKWTYGRLNCYLKDPSACVPGNKMTYAGVKDDAKRANIIAYLASLGDAPPLPGSQQEADDAAMQREKSSQQVRSASAEEDIEKSE